MLHQYSLFLPKSTLYPLKWSLNFAIPSLVQQEYVNTQCLYFRPSLKQMTLDTERKSLKILALLAYRTQLHSYAVFQSQWKFRGGIQQQYTIVVNVLLQISSRLLGKDALFKVHQERYNLKCSSSQLFLYSIKYSKAGPLTLAIRISVKVCLVCQAP